MTVVELHRDELILARYRSRYAAQDKVATLLAVMVKGLAAVVPRRRAASEPPKRILIANAGHIGDGIMSTSVLAPLKMMFREAEIDFLTNSESRSVVAGHPDQPDSCFCPHASPHFGEAAFDGKESNDMMMLGGKNRRT